jgi:L-ribulose-5-phosphate 3-epimerase
MNRRDFLGSTIKAPGAICLAAAATSSIGQAAKAETTVQKPGGFVPNPIAISTYSFWRFRDDSKLDMPKCIDLAAQMGFDGVELLRIQMEDDSDSYLQKLKRQAFVNGLDLVGMSTHQGFVTPDAQARKENVDKTIGFIEMAYKLGIPTIRVNTGRWRTTKSFDQLMADKGIEKRLDGYSDDDGFKWVIDALEQCLPTAEKCGVILGLENHWGLGRTAEGVMRIIKAIDSPWLKATLDTGNFFERRQEQFKLMAPETVFVQAKTYFGGGTWYDIDIDYPAIAKIMQDVNYRGYISLEFEGQEDYKTAIPKSLNVLRESFGKRQ